MITYSGSSSDALVSVLAAAPQPARVLGAGPLATYLMTAAGDVLAVVAAGAVRVPCAVVLSGRTPVPTSLRPEASVRVGDGGIRWPEGEVRVSRWWRAAAVGPGSFTPPRLRTLTARLADHHLPAGVDAVLAAASAALADSDPEGAARHLVLVLGLGAGLTPSADDAVAGWLLASRVTAGDRIDQVAELVAAAAPARTTAVSAALLMHAGRGRAAPQVVTAIAALAGDGPLGPAFDVLWALGHSSGADTAAGVLVAARAVLADRRAA